MLDGVAGNIPLNQADGIHPNSEGVAVLVPKISPAIKLLLQKVVVSN
jgi:acyl-CoA thioesterase I